MWEMYTDVNPKATRSKANTAIIVFVSVVFVSELLSKTNAHKYTILFMYNIHIYIFIVYMYMVVLDRSRSRWCFVFDILFKVLLAYDLIDLPPSHLY